MMLRPTASRLTLTLLAILIPMVLLSPSAAFAQLQNLTQNQNFSQPQILNLTPPAPVTLKILSQNAFTENNPYLQANPILQTLHIVGEVQNNSTEAAQNVQLSATLYDSNNEVVGVGKTAVPYTMNPGQKAPFEIRIFASTVKFGDLRVVKSYYLQATGS